MDGISSGAAVSTMGSAGLWRNGGNGLLGGGNAGKAVDLSPVAVTPDGGVLLPFLDSMASGQSAEAGGSTGCKPMASRQVTAFELDSIREIDGLITELENGQSWLTVNSAAFRLSETVVAIGSGEAYKQLVGYFAERGITHEETVKRLIRLDLMHIEQALGMLFHTPTGLISELLSELGIKGDCVSACRVEHVGRELLGPVDIYLKYLTEQAPSLGLHHDPFTRNGATVEGNLIFNSTQVVASLQKLDANLSGVTIGRIYFKPASGPNASSGLELFQASAMSNHRPQHILYSLKRLASLVTAENRPAAEKADKPVTGHCHTAVGHIAIEVPEKQTLETLLQQARLAQHGNITLYQDRISFNPADGSHNVKVVINDAMPHRSQRIVEFIFYQ